jgi:hypothetical protein
VDENWKITYIDRKVVDAPIGMIAVEWKLNHIPEPDWIKYFISGPGRKSGSGDFISRAPQVSGSRIRFEVHEQDLENATRWIPDAIESANTMFETYVISRRRREEADRQEKEAAKERRIAEAQERLDRLDP